MSGALTHSPADVVRQLLIDMDLAEASTPLSPPSWSVYVGAEPDTPDSAVTIYDTEGRIAGFTNPDGEAQEYHGIQVRVRAPDYASGSERARAIAVGFDEEVNRDNVTIGAVNYCVCSVTRTSDVISLGMDKPASRRQLFTINALANVRKL